MAQLFRSSYPLRVSNVAAVTVSLDQGEDKLKTALAMWNIFTPSAWLLFLAILIVIYMVTCLLSYIWSATSHSDHYVEQHSAISHFVDIFVISVSFLLLKNNCNVIILASCKSDNSQVSITDMGTDNNTAHQFIQYVAVGSTFGKTSATSIRFRSRTNCRN